MLGKGSKRYIFAVSLAFFAFPIDGDADVLSGKATVKCGAFSGMPDKRPGWESRADYSVNGTQIAFQRLDLDKAETQIWSGLMGYDGRILLVGSGGDSVSKWEMEFSGNWSEKGKTTLTGAFKVVSGVTGFRKCEISLER